MILCVLIITNYEYYYFRALVVPLVFTQIKLILELILELSSLVN